MSLPVLKVLWAPTNSAHYNHLHVEGDPAYRGTPSASNPGMSDSVWAIYGALAERFGEPAYFQDRTVSTDWTHMGWYNRRYIAGTTTWSQHAYSNAIDIGPYYGVTEQKMFYDFLTGQEDENMAFTAREEQQLKKLVAEIDQVNSDAGFLSELIEDIRKDLITKDELVAALSAVQTAATVDSTARSLAKRAMATLARIKETI